MVKLVIAAPVSLMTLSVAVQLPSVPQLAGLKNSVTVTVVLPGVSNTASQIVPVVPPQPFVNTIGSTPSARATEAEIPRNATTTNK